MPESRSIHRTKSTDRIHFCAVIRVILLATTVVLLAAPLRGIANPGVGNRTQAHLAVWDTDVIWTGVIADRSWNRFLAWGYVSGYTQSSSRAVAVSNDDGLTWELRRSSSPSFDSVAVGRVNYAFLAKYYNRSDRIVRSEDGLAWSGVDMPSGDRLGKVFNFDGNEGEMVLRRISRGLQEVLQSSTNSTSWTDRRSSSTEFYGGAWTVQGATGFTHRSGIYAYPGRMLLSTAGVFLGSGFPSLTHSLTFGEVNLPPEKFATLWDGTRWRVYGVGLGQRLWRSFNGGNWSTVEDGVGDIATMDESPDGSGADRLYAIRGQKLQERMAGDVWMPVLDTAGYEVSYPGFFKIAGGNAASVAVTGDGRIIRISGPLVASPRLDSGNNPGYSRGIGKSRLRSRLRTLKARLQRAKSTSQRLSIRRKIRSVRVRLRNL